MTSTPGVLVDDNVLEVLRKAQLDEFTNKFIFVFNVRRFDHFSHVRDKDMQDIGMQQPQIRQLREQILKMSREMWNRSDPKQIYVQADQSTPAQSSIDEKALIPNEQIKVYEMLGEGSFAVVKRGVWMQGSGQKVDVAVKILRDISPNIMDDLRVEASHLLKLQHPSLIRLYGIVRQPAMMVFELCEGGSLLDRLRDDKKPVLLVSRLHDYCIQIAKALQFLESKHCVHRDVAARNILLAKDEKTVKICDFGLMRALKDNEQMYTMAPQKKVPFAWCPPEALRHRKFSHASDVWSYGVTIWEVFTFGEEPWVGCRAIDVLKNMDAGERLEKPKHCSQRIYQIMQKCWKSNPAERCKFSEIREDLKAAMFLEAVAREAFNSIQPGMLQLVKNDEVVVVENTGEDWFGQCKKNQKFGFFPRTVVFAQANHAVTAPLAVTPQKLPTAPTIRAPPPQQIQPTILPFAQKPLNNNNITSINDRSSRISMPIAGSFIHTGHGNPLGGQSWGSPGSIDQMYLKNPVKGVPLSRMSNGAEIIESKAQLTNGGRSTHINAAQPATVSSVRSSLRGLSLDLPEYDDFDRAFDESFSPSTIELPRGFGNDSMLANNSISNRSDDFVFVAPSKAKEPTFDIRGNILKPTPVEKVQPAPVKPIVLAPSTGVSTSALNIDPLRNQPRHVNSAGSRLDSMANSSAQLSQKNMSNGNLPSSLIPELRSRLELGNDFGNPMRPRPASSIGVQNNGMESVGNNVQRPFSVVNLPTAPVHQPTTIPCLVPTPAPVSNTQVGSRTTANQQNPLQKALTDELKGNLSRRPTNAAPIQPIQRNGSTSVGHQVRMPPQTAAPNTSAPIAPTPVAVPRPPAQQVPVMQPMTNHGTTTPVKPLPAAVVSAAPVKGPGPAKATPSPATASPVARRLSPTTTQVSEEDRRSKIIMEINSALPPPSSLLFGGSSSTSALPTASNGPSTSIVRERPATVVPSKPQPTMPPPKKSSEPALPTAVLQPTRLPSSSTTTVNAAAQPTRNVSPPIVAKPAAVIEEKKANAPVQNTNVPLYNLTNSSNMYPPLNGYPNYGNGYQPYGYGMNYNHGGYHGYQGYNPYLSGMGQLALTHNAMSSLPPLVPSENHFSGATNPLGESDIHEFLGAQNRPPPVSTAAPATSAPRPTSAPVSTSDLSMADKMEVLYKEADFTQRGNCDSMVRNCSGDTELALKMLKQQHLMDIGLSDSTDKSRRALESTQYDLMAAANLLLG